MDTQRIEDMILILENSESTELEVKSGESFVRIIKSHRTKPKKAAPKKKTSREEQIQVGQTSPSVDEFITAPMVGIFHSGKAGITLDSDVTVGQNVGVIESMKLHNELVSRVAGTVKEVMVEDGTPVEYGQPLFRVGPLVTE